MAKVTNAFDTYTATADREDLSNIIYNISPMQTPFMSSIGTRNVKNVVFDWQTESLPTPSASGELEGFELSRAASTATTRASNVCMISKRDATVNFFFFGRLPIIVSTPVDDIIVTSSPILSPSVKLNSFPIEI